MLSQTGRDPVLYSRKAYGLVRVLLRKRKRRENTKKTSPMHFPPRFPVLLITLTLIRGLPYPQVLAQELDEGFRTAALLRLSRLSSALQPCTLGARPPPVSHG